MGTKPSYKELEERLQAVEERYHHLNTIIDNAADLISAHDHTGVFRYASPAVFDLTGYRPEELVGRSAYDFIHADDIENVRRSHRQIQKASVVTSLIYRFRHKRGHFVWLDWNQIESYIRDHSEAEFSHRLCAECAKRHYPELDLDSEK